MMAATTGQYYSTEKKQSLEECLLANRYPIFCPNRGVTQTHIARNSSLCKTVIPKHTCPPSFLSSFTPSYADVK